MTRASEITLLDVADRLLDTGVSLTGEATVSVADVDLIYLGLDVVLASVEKVRGKGMVPLIPFPRWPDALAQESYPPRADRGPQDEVEHGGPSEGFPRARVGQGPGAMSADEYRVRPPGAQTETRSGEVEHPVRASGFAASEVGIVQAIPERIAVDPDNVERGLAKLVLTIVEFVRQLLERQAVRRMDGGGLTDAEVERVGVALMRLEQKVAEMAARFGLKPEELRLGLGPLGQLL